MSRPSSARSSSPACRRSSSTSRRRATACSRWTRCARATASSGISTDAGYVAYDQLYMSLATLDDDVAEGARGRGRVGRGPDLAQAPGRCRAPPGAHPRDGGACAVPRLRADGLSRERLTRIAAAPGLPLNGSAASMASVEGGRDGARIGGGVGAAQAPAGAQAFDALRPFLTLTEIADAAGMPLSTAHRLVAELEREGLARADAGPDVPAGRAALGVRVAHARRARAARARPPVARAPCTRGCGSTRSSACSAAGTCCSSSGCRRGTPCSTRRSSADAPRCRSARAGSCCSRTPRRALVDEVIAAGLAGVHLGRRSAAATRCGRSCGTCAPTASR